MLQKSLFSLEEIDEFGDLKHFRLVLDYLPDRRPARLYTPDPFQLCLGS